MEKIYKVGIIGGGISGAVTALELAKYNIDCILFEQEKSLVNGPPFCHLHAGGNLYPDITEKQCRQLMLQSIEMARLFPQSIDKRPTFISVPKSENFDTEKIKSRLEMLVKYYKQLIAEDPANEILGAPDSYYQTYSQEELIVLAKNATVQHPNSLDEWMSNTLQLIDIEQLKTPVFMVQEYGWNLFRLGAQAQLALEKASNCNLSTNTQVTSIKDIRDKGLDYNWEISTKDAVYKVEYLVNSSGFKTGEFDKSVNIHSKRFIEFKAAYLSKWKALPGLIPELIFHGERGTANGMVQLTPYNGNNYQIHAMTKEITLFKNGLIQSKEEESQPKFDTDIQQRLARSWDEQDITTRTEKSIAAVAKFVPSFGSATVGGPPLYGAQQVPGDDLSLRVGEVCFPTKFYARNEIVKASSALTVAKQIISKLEEDGLISPIKNKLADNALLNSITKNDIDVFAANLASERGYNPELSKLLIAKN